MWKPFIDNFEPIFRFSITMWQGAVLPTQELRMLSNSTFLPHTPKSGTATQTWHHDHDYYYYYYYCCCCDDDDDDDDDDDVHLNIYC